MKREYETNGRKSGRVGEWESGRMRRLSILASFLSLSHSPALPLYLPFVSSIFVCFIFSLHSTTTKSEQTRATPKLEPYTLREDFQHDSLGRFASYPPAQDVGYEPSLSPTTDFDAPGGRALMRVVKPNRAGALRFGFIRQTSLVMSEGAKLSFAYRLNHAAPNDSLEIGVAGADGCRYIKRILASTNGWKRVDISLAEFRCASGLGMKTGVGMDAVYIVADPKHADADITYRFIIDEVALSAERIEAESSAVKAIALRTLSGSLHPRLYFSASDRPKLVKRTHHPQLVELW